MNRLSRLKLWQQSIERGPVRSNPPSWCSYDDIDWLINVAEASRCYVDAPDGSMQRARAYHRLEKYFLCAKEEASRPIGAGCKMHATRCGQSGCRHKMSQDASE